MNDYNEINYEKNMQMLSISIKYCEEKLLHEDIINELYNDNDLKKQLCLIELDCVKNQNEADILVHNLTEHSTPVREAASYKIADLISNDNCKVFFQTEKILCTFVKAITDINPSISRNAVEIIKYTNNKQFIYEKLIFEINKTLSEMKDLTFNKSYSFNKKNFNLYWNLEGIISIANDITINDNLIKILKQTALSVDYTIREKTAKAAKIFMLNDIISLLENDDNFYVKKYINFC